MCPSAGFPHLLGQQFIAQELTAFLQTFRATAQFSSPASHMASQDLSIQEDQTVLQETITEDTQGFTACPYCHHQSAASARTEKNIFTKNTFTAAGSELSVLFNGRANSLGRGATVMGL